MANEPVSEITIKFKDKSRSDLKIKTSQPPFMMGTNLIRIEIATNGKVSVFKTFNADIIEEITEVVRSESEEKK